MTKQAEAYTALEALTDHLMEIRDKTGCFPDAVCITRKRMRFFSQAALPGDPSNVRFTRIMGIPIKELEVMP